MAALEAVVEKCKKCKGKPKKGVSCKACGDSGLVKVTRDGSGAVIAIAPVPRRPQEV